MTYLELLSWARKGISAEQDHLRRMKEKAIEGMHTGSRGAKELVEKLQEDIDKLDVKMVSLNELEDIHNRTYS